ncbi:hypothetical protein BP1258A_5854 [Burkholderia pseudomallei 1258a]|uniref:Uncharacterized protein n=1 Tax=Burkholderia pseudomallei (strain 1026b) TaxID=884204 RepID=A0A0H3HEB6_BURP2|nr:hypothetical protein BP1026B_I0214 [Burkholderia pseudomallei 1026b]EIF52236.1 hypothetical protein BP1258A_5854 [Burkholderia pseudomallei 1258a]EIF55720.1 hypothetical protein BP1026A_4730 [Burkholderia pseudomallei 1026a]EIF71806.1 hypothetical protein BP1258B_0146 [Burkholderia pseudomallei 1258b]EIF78390.1 hypothetical protein BP354E_0152 [Burkholderia pseudomallei 354e]EIF82635.1 hypothetical protein BP354A_0173 [Burkholderia pseudomallei 354a]
MLLTPAAPSAVGAPVVEGHAPIFVTDRSQVVAILVTDR